MLVIQAYLGDSPIHSKGLFSAKAIAKGRPVWYFDPTKDMIISQNDIPEELRDYLDKYSTVTPVTETINTILGFQTLSYGLVNYNLDGDDCKYMNHSETPNVGFVGNIGIALADIAAHEELTCDYRLITTPEHFEFLMCTIDNE